MDLVLVRFDRYIKAHCFFGVRRAKEFKVLKCLVNIFVLLLITKCLVQSVLVEVNFSLAIKLQPDIIIRATLQVAFNFKKQIKVKIESNFYCTRQPQIVIPN